MANEKKDTIHKHILKLSYEDTSLSQYSDFRIYRNATILAPGEWTDCISHSAIVYSADELTKAATNWKENYLDLDHSFAVNDRIGYVKNPHAENGCVKADLYILKNVQAGKDTITRIDCGLINSVSAELMTSDRYDFKTDKYLAENIIFLGAAVVGNPACTSATIR